jgi:hypothetical protein
MPIMKLQILAICLGLSALSMHASLGGTPDPHPAKIDNALPVEPDPAITPGVIDPALTKEIICDPTHHTKSDRHVTDADKAAAYLRYGMVVPKVQKAMPSGKVSTVYNFHVGYCATAEGCEVDHLVSIENGGSNEAGNLWPEIYSGTIWTAHPTDIVENRLHKLVCIGRIELAEDQHTLQTDWIAGWYKYVSPVAPMPDGSIDKDHTPGGYGL